MLDFCRGCDIMVLHWKTEIPEAPPLAINPESAWLFGQLWYNGSTPHLRASNAALESAWLFRWIVYNGFTVKNLRRAPGRRLRQISIDKKNLSIHRNDKKNL
jgi:hypothetical protein